MSDVARMLLTWFALAVVACVLIRLLRGPARRPEPPRRFVDLLDD